MTSSIEYVLVEEEWSIYHFIILMPTYNIRLNYNLHIDRVDIKDIIAFTSKLTVIDKESSELRLTDRFHNGVVFAKQANEDNVYIFTENEPDGYTSQLLIPAAQLLPVFKNLINQLSDCLK
jgi:hypothetical protein